MGEKARCEVCGRNFKDHDGLRQHQLAKHPEFAEESLRQEASKMHTPARNFKKHIIAALVVLLLLSGIWLLIKSSKNLPPTTIEGHVEAFPPSHVLREPMPIAMQKHMLEHADGRGLGGVIINYNCEDFECEQGLIERLEEFAMRYPANVYVAPYKNMDAKIALTRLGKIEVLSEFDESKIKEFIERR